MNLDMLEQKAPVVKKLCQAEEVSWINPYYGRTQEALKDMELTMADVEDAAERLARFAPFIRKAFPETEITGGIIESPLKEIPAMKRQLEKDAGAAVPGRLFLKCDSHLAVSGSVKARGGIYEVLKFAEKVATEKGMLTRDDDYSVLTEDRFRELFGQYSVAVGSTGNLGLSIGIISAKLGFKVTVWLREDGWRQAIRSATL